MVPKVLAVNDESISAAGGSSANVHTANTFNALRDLESLEEYVSETLVKVVAQKQSEGDRAAQSSAVNEMVRDTPADLLMDLVTVPGSGHDDDGGHRVFSAEEEDNKARLLAEAKELARQRQLRAELKAARAAAKTAATSSVPGSTDLQVPAASMGQPRRDPISPNSPHPTHIRVEAKLRDMGKLPTAYELNPGDSDSLKCMDKVVFKKWSDLPDAKSDSEDDDSTGGSPLANSNSPQ